jgi:hypothetical protein
VYILLFESIKKSIYNVKYNQLTGKKAIAVMPDTAGPYDAIVLGRKWKW